MSNENLTEKTLADVQAGIPARDAEIETLRKENKELREQLEAIGAGGVNGKLMPGKSQQPVSGADGLDERAEFEKAWTSYPGRKTPIRFDDGEYQYPAANTAWRFWQARAALAQQGAETGKSVLVGNQGVVVMTDLVWKSNKEPDQ